MKYYILILIILTQISCKNTINTMESSVYEKATKHLSQHMNKYVKNNLISQKWKNNNLYFRLKSDTIFKSFKINLTNLELTQEAFPIENSSRTNYLEFVSPDKKKSVYIKNHNLWVKDLTTKKSKQLTYNGYQDYGYGTNNAGWIKNDRPVLKWSDDSKIITTFRQDARKVGEMYLTTTNVGHPNLQKWKYTLPGDENIFEIERLFINVETGKVTPFKMKRDYQRSTTTDHIAGRGGILLDANFSSDGKKLAFISSSRDHKEAHLKIADVKTGNVKSIYEEVTNTYYESGVSGENWRVFFKTNEFLWYSEKDDWGHLYLHDLTTGQLKNQITSGEWLVRDVLYVDEVTREIFFTGGGKGKETLITFISIK